ncbi:MAG: hypothetical protein H0X64_03395 [Gemmatimonadaceae bacterium]|nr:hypothetical protein [Gemmatimonadaceae bacterium]
MSVEAFIAYDPPDGGQPLRGSPDDAWHRTTRFLQHCTTARPDRPHSVKLTVYEPAGDDPPEWYRPTLAAAHDRFGRAERRAWATGVDELYCTEWDLDAAHVGAARTFLAEGEPWPRTAVGPAEVLVGYTFRWIDLESGEPLAGQEPSRRAHPNQAESTLLLGLGRRSWIMLLGRFPFQAANAGFITYLEQVAAYVPVRLSPVRFRHWIPTLRASQTGYTVRRIDAGLLDGISG